MDPNFVNIAIVVVYLIAMLAFGWWGKSRTRNNSDFLVAGRRLGPFLYTGTMAAVVLGGASTVGGVGLGHKFGISGMWLVFGKDINTEDTDNPEHDVKANRLWVLGLGTVAILIAIITKDVVAALIVLEVNAEVPLDGVFASEPIYFGLITSALVYVAVSLLTRPTDPQVMRNWVRRVAGKDNEEVPVAVPAR